MRRTDARRSVLLALLLVAPSASSPLFPLALVSTSRAAEITDVASSFDEHKVFDFRLRVGYEFTNKSGAVKREHEGDPNQQKIDVFKDLVYAQQRHTMNLQAQLGLYHDFMLTVGLPLVLSDQRTLSYDQRLGAECIYQGKNANCVNAQNSLTTNSAATQDASDPDPSHYIVPAGGFDAANGGTPFAGSSDLVFRGPKRGGSGSDVLDTVNLALTWAALSQKRDSTKPTWTIALEYQLSIGNVMKLDRMKPDANHGVADGLDHLIARTAVSHRFKYLDPYAAFWFDYPVLRRGDTLFTDYGPTAKNQLPQLAGGTIMGLELIPYERADLGYRVAFDLNARIQGKFDGRGYSEIWEMLASSPALGCAAPPSVDSQWNPACDTSKTSNAYQGRPYSGITTIQNYAQFAAEIALAVQATRFLRFRLNFLYQQDQSHLVTVDDVGKPDAAGARVSKATEYNPAFRPIINEIGRRYIVDGMSLYQIGLWGQLMF